ncbi:MAG TPA: hypothetical protein VGM25_01090 [Caulobacteraceae bacterium]|jgi:hypothetical protein
MRTRLLAIAAAAAAAALAGSAAMAQGWADLPDWSGDWTVVKAKAADPAPPYKPEWAAKARANAAALKANRSADPFSTCGLPAGAPRMLSLPGVHEWVVRPGEVWHAVEDGNTVQRIYTDGRKHPEGDDLFATYTGDNVGHWEGRVLVIDTVGLRPDTWLDGAGAPHSDQTHVTTRVRKVGAELQADIEIDDPMAFNHPWKLVRRYSRLPAGSFVHDFACRIIRSAADAKAAE